MPQQQPQDQPTKVSKGDALGLLYQLAACHALCVTPILRSRQGSEAFGVRAVVALVVMATLALGRWRSPMGAYLAVWLAFLVVRRVQAFNRWRRGEAVHTRYVGDPWLAMKFRIVRSERQARAFEPVLCLLLGGALALVAPVVGLLVAGGFVSLPVCAAIEHLLVFARVQRMTDAAIEGEFYAAEHRRTR